jgi:hypothetical protein
MRFLVACRYLREKNTDGYIYEEVSNSLSDCLVWLHNKYREARDTKEVFFEWVIFDFETKDVYFDVIRCIKDTSFIEAILDLSQMSKFLKITNK